MDGCKHKRDYYACKRLRLLQYLKERGFMPYATIPEPTNVKYSWWLFENTPELEACVEQYFAQLQKKKEPIKIDVFIGDELYNGGNE